jgi:hypothetical protein
MMSERGSIKKSAHQAASAIGSLPTSLLLGSAASGWNGRNWVGSGHNGSKILTAIKSLERIPKARHSKKDDALAVHFPFVHSYSLLLAFNVEQRIPQAPIIFR